jgi:hypothetical protein
MPSVTVSRSNVSVEEAIEAIRAQLGTGITAEPQDGGKIRVTQGSFSIVHVKVVPQGGSTVLHVHGGGLIIGRLINELTIARKVAAALKTGLTRQG